MLFPRFLFTGCLVIAFLLGATGCLGMFEPDGGSYARGRYGKPDSFPVSVQRDPEGALLLFTPDTSKSAMKLKWVYFFIEGRPGLSKTNGPKATYKTLPDGKLSVRVRPEDLQRYDGLELVGDYLEPAKVIGGARSVEASGKFYFSSLRSESPNNPGP